LDPNHIHLPGIYVDRIVPATTDRQVEFMTIAPASSLKGMQNAEPTRRREMMARVSWSTTILILKAIS
jgi:3-oxoacid CoA-transferase